MSFRRINLKEVFFFRNSRRKEKLVQKKYKCDRFVCVDYYITSLQHALLSSIFSLEYFAYFTIRKKDYTFQIFTRYSNP